jgi:hypothetical protein
MAYSHAEVAAAFARGERAREGTNLKCIKFSMDSDAEFQKLTDAISYSTQIARRVVNKFTGKPEMWVTSRYYSQSTARHKRHLYDAYRKFCEANGHEPIVYESASFLNRTNPTGLESLLNNATYELWEVDRPRTRDATRRGVLSSRLHRLNHAVHNITTDRDPQFITNDERVSALLRHADEHKQQLQHWLMLPTDEMRATVKAYLTLNEVPRLNFDTSTRPR